MRGQYRALDRDAAPIQAWAVGEVIEGTVGPTIRLGQRAVRGTRGVYHGVRGLAPYRGMTRAQVGSEWFHSVADRQRAVSQLNTGFQVLAAELAAVLTANPTANGAQWLTADVTPVLKEWSDFARRESDSWLTRAATDWTAFEEWTERLKRLREIARAHGLTLTSPEPSALPTTVWDRASKGSGTDAVSWLGVARIGVLGVIGLAGVHGLYTVWRDLRRHRDTVAE